MTPQKTVIELAKEAFHFSAAHFTIFSSQERENLHGHNFFLKASVVTTVGADGLAFDYNLIKVALKAFCEQLDERTLLPGESPHLKIDREGDYLVAEFADERIPFLVRDALVLPVSNITVEALAAHAVDVLRTDAAVVALPLEQLVVRISSGPGQWASAEWSRA